MKRILLVSLFLVGCDNPFDETPRALPLNKCTKEELSMVNQYMNACNKTGWLSSHCFSTALKVYCKETP